MDSASKIPKRLCIKTARHAQILKFQNEDHHIWFKIWSTRQSRQVDNNSVQLKYCYLLNIMHLWNFTDSSCKPFPGCGRPRKAESGDQHLFQTGMLAALLASLCPGTGPSLKVKTCTHIPLHTVSASPPISYWPHQCRWWGWRMWQLS